MKSEMVPSGGHGASVGKATEAPARISTRDYTLTMTGGAGR